MNALPSNFSGSELVDEFTSDGHDVEVRAFAWNDEGLEVRVVNLRLGDLDVDIPIGAVDRVVAGLRSAKAAAESATGLA